MDDELEVFLKKLCKGIVDHPDLHTKALNFGAWVYDRMAMIGGQTYYIRVSFDWNSATNTVTILTTTAEPLPGPH